MTKTANWFEVYQFIDNNLIMGTETIRNFPTIEDAKKFTDGNLNYFIDEWQGNDDGTGIPTRVL